MAPLAQSEQKARAPAGRVIVFLVVVLATTAVLVAASGVTVRTRLLTGSLVTAAFALAAYSMRAVTPGGAWAGAAVSYALYAAAGPGAFFALVTVFLLAVVSTHIGYGRKQGLGKAESRRGRSAAQVLANLGAAAVLATGAALAPAWLHYPLLIASAAALAEAAADTVSSECGVAWSEQVRLITSWERVAPGTDGGVSLPGTLAGVVGALGVAAVCAAAGMVGAADVPLVAGAAVVGTFFDSVLGATLQRQRVMGNNAVNVAGTVFAALIALAVAAS